MLMNEGSPFSDVPNIDDEFRINDSIMNHNIGRGFEIKVNPLVRDRFSF
jgi:hypothetical protein